MCIGCHYIFKDMQYIKHLNIKTNTAQHTIVHQNHVEYKICISCEQQFMRTVQCRL